MAKRKTVSVNIIFSQRKTNLDLYFKLIHTVLDGDKFVVEPEATCD